MNKAYLKKAESLAKRPYQAHVFLDETTEGEPVYVAVLVVNVPHYDDDNAGDAQASGGIVAPAVTA